jgi:hypothetical protein
MLRVPRAPFYLGSSRCARPLPLRRNRPCRSSRPLRLTYFFASRNLPESQEGLHQCALAADNHLRETLEPLTPWDFGFGNEAVSELTKLIGGNFSFSDSIKQMIQQCRRKILYLGCFPQRSTATSRLYRPCRGSQPLHCRRILGMLSLTVKAADDLLPDSRLFRRISRCHHALCQTG